MLFPTAEYGIFFLGIFALSWALHRRALPHKLVLLLASWGFYAFWDWRFVPLLAGVSLWGTVFARAIQRAPGAPSRALLAVGVSGALAVLVFFKYFTFLAVELLSLFERFGVPTYQVRLPDIALPVGISFFTFHVISMMVDAYRDQIPVRVRFVDGLLYVAFFPQLVAGPILRASDFLPQLDTPPDPKRIDAARALELIALGLIKKVLIAGFLGARVVDPFFDLPEAHAGVWAWLAFYGYAAQIYCDFSGYSDIATGSALLLGYRFPANFDSPYIATSVRDFWRRWHISLSSWLRDYLFIPLGGSRAGAVRTSLNLAATLLLGGLWHGAAWTFIAWGALHALGVLAHRAWRASGWTLHPAAAWAVTFHFVCLGWVFFRAPSLEVAGEALDALLAVRGAPAGLVLATALAVGFAIAGQWFPRRGQAWLRERFAALPLVAQGALFALTVQAIEALGPQGVAPFIYFQF